MIFASVLLVTLVVLVWRRYPMGYFLMAMTAWTFQAFNVAHSQSTEQWVRVVWAVPEAFAVFLTALAVAESVEASGESLDANHRFHLRVAATFVPACILGLAALFSGWVPLTLFEYFRMLREYVWVGLTITLLSVEMFARFHPRIPRSFQAATHSTLLWILVGSHAAIAPFVDKPYGSELQQLCRLLIGGCCAGWITLAVIGERPLLPGGRQTTH